MSSELYFGLYKYSCMLSYMARLIAWFVESFVCWSSLVPDISNSILATRVRSGIRRSPGKDGPGWCLTCMTRQVQWETWSLYLAPFTLPLTYTSKAPVERSWLSICPPTRNSSSMDVILFSYIHMYQAGGCSIPNEWSTPGPARTNPRRPFARERRR